MKKCELVLAADDTDTDLIALFPHAVLADDETSNSRVLTRGCFELLGAAIGDEAFCENYASDKVATASKLLHELGELDDPQVALRLMRNCGGVCKVTHSMRMTPPNLQTSALAEFDTQVRKTFSAITGIIPNNSEWDQACCGVRKAGVGLRCASMHAEAAYLSSTCSSRDLCHKLDSSFQLQAAEPSSAFGASLAGFNGKLPSSDQLDAQAVIGKTQKALSELLDKAVFDRRMATLDLSDQATILSECQPGAYNFWQATPAQRSAVPAAEFCEELRYRLCVPDRADSSWCPLCDSIMDNRGHHSRRCCAGGDRVTRHNGQRNIIFNFCRRAGLRPELEKADLLPPGPSDGSSQRRPADVYLLAVFLLHLTLPSRHLSDRISLARHPGSP